VDKRYQVFVSSTYKDLIEERQEVMKALLEIDCFPSAMELFPAADDSQWDYIRQIIDECDYYILILAGRYGSTEESTGISYTEKEYRYALEIGKPVIAFLHENPLSLTGDKLEQGDIGKEKLTNFRNFVQNKLCKMYRNPTDLASVVSRSMTQLKKSRPSVGWVRSDSVISGNSAEEVLKLRKQIDLLNEKIAENKKNELNSIENIINEDSLAEIKINIFDDPKGKPIRSENATLIISFKNLLETLLPHFFEVLNTQEAENIIEDHIRANGFAFNYVEVNDNQYITIEVLRHTTIKILIKLKNMNIITETNSGYGLTNLGELLIATNFV
jgi:Domain of unknown function (DUF4062)